MDAGRRRELARQALDGYAHGPAAATEPTGQALARLTGASTVVLVEGASDRIAVETVATRCGTDLSAAGAVVVPAGGAHAFTRLLAQLGPTGRGLRVIGLCDVAEEPALRPAFSAAGVPRTRLYVCFRDLEDELLGAVGPDAALRVLEGQGDLAAFRRFQSQPAWRGRDVRDQLRRWLGAGASRKLRYARRLVEACDESALPRPLTELVAAV